MTYVRTCYSPPTLDVVIVDAPTCVLARAHTHTSLLAALACARTPPHAHSPPYLLLPLTLLTTPAKSNAPLTSLYLTPGRSCTLPPLTSTTECSCRLCPSPGIYAVMTLPFEQRTFATFRRAEFGFLGFVVKIFEQTAFTNGLPSSAGTFEGRPRRGTRAPRSTCRYVVSAAGVDEKQRSDGGDEEDEEAIGVVVIVGLVAAPRERVRSEEVSVRIACGDRGRDVSTELRRFD